MSRRRRMPHHLTAHATRYHMSTWLRANKNVPFNIPYLCEQIGLDSECVSDRNKVYGGILYWRKRFVEEYNKWRKVGLFKEKDRYQAWDMMLLNFNQNDAYVFLSVYDKKMKTNYFIQPGFDELENMDKKRLEKQWKGIGTIIKEMQVEEARLILPGGSRKPVSELIEAGKEVNKLLPHRDID